MSFNYDDDGVESPQVELGFAAPTPWPRNASLAGQPRKDPLRELLGPVRSTVLSLVTAGGLHTTTELSVRLQLAPSTVSYHLSALKRAGLVRADRDGAQVSYRTTDAGHRILAAWD